MAKTGHPNFTLKFKSPWRGNPHQWTITSSHSGATFATQAEALSFLNGVYNVVSSFFAGATSTFCSGYDYYDGQNSAALWQAEYVNQAAATADGFGTTQFGLAYGSGSEGYAGLESCAMLYAPVGLSKTGKPVRMRKFIHGVPGGAGADELPLAAAPAPQNIAKQLGDGSLPGSRVLITASGKQGTWTVDQYYGNHQMPRKSKKKASSSSNVFGSLISDLSHLASVAGTAAESL